MQKITRKQRRERPWVRWALLAGLLLVLAALAIWLYTDAVRRAEDRENADGKNPAGFAAPAGGIDLPTLRPAGAEQTAVPLRKDDTHTATEETGGEDGAESAGLRLAAIAVTLPDGTAWIAEQTEPGVLMVHADGSVYPMRDTLARSMIWDAGTVTARTVLSGNTNTLPEPLSAYGLDPARMTVVFTYSDGSERRLLIGNRNGDLEESFYYMMVGGDPRLFALDAATAEDFAYEAPVLRAFGQPVLHAARIDRVEVWDGDGLRAWKLDADIGDPDAADRWTLTEPFRYACDGDMILNLRRNIAAISLASLVGDATPEARRMYGFDSPAARITVHQAAGTILGVGDRGAVEEQEWEEDTFELLVGGMQSEMMDYVLWAGSIWTIPHFRLAGILSLTPDQSLTRYPVLTGLNNLQRMTLETADGERHAWTVTRTVSAEGEQISVDLDGEPIDWKVFEANYNRLLMATVSGRLPAGWTPSEDPHTIFTFETETGARHSIALSAYTALQDAVTVDGETVFYLAKGGLDFSAE